MSFVRSYVVPEGFPHTVSPSYVPYMTWRALKVYSFNQNHFFGDLLKRSNNEYFLKLVYYYLFIIKQFLSKINYSTPMGFD